MPSSSTPPLSPSVFADTQANLAAAKFHAYEKVRLLGRGQHGAAVLLRSPATGDLVVAKQVATEGLSEHDQRKVEDEVRILARFSHANVVSYYCCFLHEETLSIVMEYCDGGTLAEAIKSHTERGEHFATALVATWAKQLGGAVAHVHSHRVLHRDIKTANVFLTAQRQIKLGDFGISRVMGTHTNLAETVCGTPYYLSPELVMGQPYNQPADAWAIGVILYELLTLKRPFTGPNIAALVLKITRCDYDRAALGDSPHPPELHSLATSDALLAADPERMATAVEEEPPLPPDGLQIGDSCYAMGQVVTKTWFAAKLIGVRARSPPMRVEYIATLDGQTTELLLPSPRKDFVNIDQLRRDKPEVESTEMSRRAALEKVALEEKEAKALEEKQASSQNDDDVVISPDLMCVVCERPDDEPNMLVCDCKKGYHIYCLTPALEEVPEGDWKCPKCAKK